MSRILSSVFAFSLGVAVTGSVAVASGSYLAEAGAQVAAAQGSLAQLDRGLDAIPDRRLRRSLEARLDQARSHVDSAAFVIAEAASRPPPARPGPPPARPTPPPVRPHPPHGRPGQVLMFRPDEVRHLASMLDDATFGDAQLALLGSAVQGRGLTTADAQLLAREFTFDDGKVDALALMFPSVVDPQNWYAVYGELTFSSSHDELRSRTR